MHKEDISSLALHSNKRYVATGSLSLLDPKAFAEIYIWDVETKQVLGHLNDFHLNGIE